MKVNSINNVSFEAKIKINKIARTFNEITNPQVCAGSSLFGTSASGVSGVLSSNIAGTALDTTGSAFISQQSGLNSSGIVPSVMENLKPHITVDTAFSMQNNPSLFGSFFSSLGGYIRRMGRININNTNIPN